MKDKIFSSSELCVLCTELGEIWHAGMPLSDGLYALCGDSDEAGPVLRALYREAENGASLPDALRKVSGFPKYMVEMLTLAEKTGKQEETLRALAAYYDRTDRLQASIRSAVLYPAILTAIMLAVIVVLITQVLPIFQGVFAQLGLQMTGLAGAMLQAGQTLSGAVAVIGCVLLVLIVLAVLARFIPACRMGISKWFQRVFGGRGVLARIASTRFLEAMTMAAQSGMEMEEAAGYASGICPDDPRTQKHIADCIQQLQSGARLGEALSGLLSARNCRLVALAERTGSQAEVFAEIAKRSERAVDDELERIISWIEPALVIITAVLVGVILLSVMLPLLGIMSSIG